MGIYLGVMFGFIAGGFIREAFDWRTPFFVLGISGLPLALLLRLTVREPARGASEAGAVDAEAPPFGEVLRTLATQRSFVLLTIGACFQAIAGYAVLSWGATFLIRVHHMSFADIGMKFGVIAGVGGAVGVTLGGFLTDRLAARDVRWNVWLPAIVSIAAAPFALPFYLSDDTNLAIAFFAPYYLLNNMYVGPLWSVAQGLVKQRMRALASASLLTVLNLAGLGLGPVLVGFANERLHPAFGDDAIRYSLLGTALAGAIAAVFFAACGRTLAHDMRRATG
jgi:predicted MFS family arabinose efflux permease